MANLNTLRLDYNTLSGTLPPSWSNLAGLAELVLWHNALTGPVPVAWTALPQLVSLYIADNPGMCGAVPAGLLTKVQQTYPGSEAWDHGTMLGQACANTPTPTPPTSGMLHAGVTVDLPMCEGIIVDPPMCEGIILDLPMC